MGGQAEEISQEVEQKFLQIDDKWEQKEKKKWKISELQKERTGRMGERKLLKPGFPELQEGVKDSPRV